MCLCLFAIFFFHVLLVHFVFVFRHVMFLLRFLLHVPTWFSLLCIFQLSVAGFRLFVVRLFVCLSMPAISIAIAIAIVAERMAI